MCGYQMRKACLTVAVKHLLDRAPQMRKKSRAIGTIVGYCILLFLVLCSYGRILHTHASDPGYLPKNHKPRRNSDSKEKSVGSNRLTGTPYEENIDSSTSRPPPDSPQPGLAYFYSKDVFICEGDGRPPWCPRCAIFKPDRTHHCSDVDRCVRKMDHFCVWVGGMVSETNFKFFFQFVTWTWLYCNYVLIVVAVSLAEYRKSVCANSSLAECNACWRRSLTV